MLKNTISKNIKNSTKLASFIVKKLACILLIYLLIMIINIALHDLYELIFYSYKTTMVFEKLYRQGWFDIDMFVKHAEHYWDIITSFLVVVVLTFGGVVPLIANLTGYKKKAKHSTHQINVNL